jgi:hypothetical protein
LVVDDERLPPSRSIGGIPWISALSSVVRATSNAGGCLAKKKNMFRMYVLSLNPRFEENRTNCAFALSPDPHPPLQFSFSAI